MVSVSAELDSPVLMTPLSQYDNLESVYKNVLAYESLVGMNFNHETKSQKNF